MKTINERVDGFVQKKPPTVKRGGPSYDATYNFCRAEIERLVEMYRQLGVEDQTARLIRDGIDVWLRRYHGYCIKENIGAHYFETGLKASDKTEFEHVTPAAVARALLLAGRITVDEALNIPTCRLSKAKHKKLNSTRLGSTTPDIAYFFKRYADLGVKIETHQGDAIDLGTWTLQDHYNYFNIV